jgi:hypothetical protein
VSDSGGIYDPTAPEGELPSRGQYMTRRDLKVIGAAILVFAVVSVPVYRMLLKQTESSRCTRNMQGIYEALTLYASEHDGRYPPIDRAESIGSIAPSLGEDGHVYTWASDVAGYLNARASFQCPSAQDSELVTTEDPRGPHKTLLSSYGMYSAYGTVLTSLVETPDTTIIVAETSNGGAQGTYDPLPLKSAGGQALPDGFVMGWDNGNENPEKTSSFVTRLAFPGTANGKFLGDGDARHGNTIHMLTAGGSMIDAKPPSAIYREGLRTSPKWTPPPITR